MEWLNNFLSGWGPWITLTGAGFAIFASLLGVSKVLGILEKVVDIVSPALKFVVETTVSAVKWLWRNIYKYGIGDIADNWRTIVTVATIVIGTGFGVMARMDHKLDDTLEKLDFCTSEKARLELAQKKSSEAAPSWFDEWFRW